MSGRMTRTDGRLSYALMHMGACAHVLGRAAILLLGGLLWAGSVHAQRSPFNGLEVLPADSTGHYRILIGGHFHGESTNRSGYPAATLLANLDTINRLGAQLFLSTGDLFMSGKEDRPRYARSLFRHLQIPLFNTPGNHDLGGAVGDDLIELGLIRLGGDIVLILNTEYNNGTVSRKAISRLLSIAKPDTGRLPPRAFIISHRPIWAENDPQYSDLFKDNTRSTFGTNFRKDVYPVLERIAQHTQVYWISGSLGGQAPSSIFFQRHAPNITYIQCAIRDEPRDALLIADVYPDTVTWSALSLTGQQVKGPETYDAAWWRARVGKEDGFNWRLLPYRMKSIVLHRAFWWGAGLMLLLVLLRRLLRR